MTTATLLPGYRLDGTLAAGRLSPVRQGIRLADGLAVVVHTVPGPLSEAQRRAFRAETARLTALPAHRHVWPVLAAVVAPDGSAHVVTPRADGSLADRIAAGGPLPVADAVQAGMAAAAGLEALHAAGVLHGALHPGNLLRGADGTVAVTGMLLPSLADSGPAGARVRPPEVLRGGDWTVAADVYALAATVYALLTGRLPYVGEPEPLLGMLTGPPPEPTRTDLPAHLWPSIRRALTPDPAVRPATPDQFAGLLLGQRPTAPSPAARLATLPPTSPVITRPGRPLGSRYLLEEPIGRGASGQVWRGRRDDGTPVAVKVLRSELTEEPDSVVRFLRERTTLVGLHHPHLVGVHDLVVEGDTFAIVMELVDGADLRQAVDSPRPSGRTATVVLGQVASALAAVHAAGIIHRDLKPENILVTGEGDDVFARLTDFGIAWTAGAAALTRLSRVVGTPAYVAPELVSGRPATAAADVYALGVVAYELLTGNRPFDGEHPAALLRAHLADKPARPRDLPAPVWRVVAACLDKEPAARPTAAELATVLPGLGPLLDGDAAAALPDAVVGPTPLGSASSIGLAGLGLASATGSTGPDVAAAADGPRRPARSGRRRRRAGKAAAAAPTAAPAHFLPTGTGHGAGLTVTASRPAPPAPAAPAPAAARNRWRWAVAGTLVAVLGATGGVLAARRSAGPGPSAPPAQPALRVYLVAVPVVATSAAPGWVQLTYAGGSDLPGFQYFAVRRSGALVAGNVPADRNTYRDGPLDPGTRYCYQVLAVVRATAPPPQPKVAEACLEPAGT
ncbi:MAG TPA: serine/threonine-protein kinase [Mycobacteriales bacterium]|nr:serine/threonine-protein kinase [Mycobacteriales bacterium]